MSNEGLTGLRLAAADVSQAAATLEPSALDTPSAAAGWTVRDVITHMGDLLDILMSAVRGELDAEGVGIEELNERRVSRKRGHNSEGAVEEFDRKVDSALEMFSGLQGEPYASTEVPFLDLGTYPLHAMADVCAFDFYTHLRWDILGPRGPLRTNVPEPDEARLRPAVGWLLAGLPNMQPGIAAHVAKPLSLTLTGPGGGRWSLLPEDGALVVSDRSADDAGAVADIRSSTHLFTAWATTRLPWREHVELQGDSTAASDFLDYLNLV
ncbi:maleylpyruvate isomerase N-terminal domain-containing protein [Streptomyces mirabilis]|uniref:maleylpyruvate isomerase N-terminal domain-containing protein n=1 Tax=Streptomyces mirabilis TaxID=68239 RepID=UPI0036814D59